MSLQELTFWFSLGRKAFNCGIKLGQVQVPPLSPEWHVWREGWMSAYDESKTIR